MAAKEELWRSGAEAELLAGRAEGFWNVDYFERVVLPMLGLRQHARVLDVGTGNGALALLLARLRPDLEVIGVDITADLVDAARAEAAARGLANATFRAGDALALAFATSTFDATVCQTLLVHLPAPEKAVVEMCRVLKPGGTFMAAEFHILGLQGPVDSASPSSVAGGERSKYTHLLLEGYRRSGQGDMQVGSRVPFMARDAGMDVCDCRINDRIAYAFPPFRKPSEQASLAEARSWANLFEDPAYRGWVQGAMSAAGGGDADVDGFLALLPQRTRDSLRRSDHSFVWLLNPVLIVTVARKHGEAAGG